MHTNMVLAHFSNTYTLFHGHWLHTSLYCTGHHLFQENSHQPSVRQHSHDGGGDRREGGYSTPRGAYCSPGGGGGGLLFARSLLLTRGRRGLLLTRGRRGLGAYCSPGGGRKGLLLTRRRGHGESGGGKGELVCGGAIHQEGMGGLLSAGVIGEGERTRTYCSSYTNLQR